jgi:hypothetical protein
MRERLYLLGPIAVIGYLVIHPAQLIEFLTWLGPASTERGRGSGRGLLCCAPTKGRRPTLFHKIDYS